MRMLLTLLAGVFLALACKPAMADDQRTDAPRYAVTAIYNDTGSEIPLQYQWGQGERKSYTVRPGHVFRIWWTYNDGSTDSPDLRVWLPETIPGSGSSSFNSWREYVCKRYASPDTEAEHGCPYTMRPGGTAFGGNVTIDFAPGKP